MVSGINSMQYSCSDTPCQLFPYFCAPKDALPSQVGSLSPKRAGVNGMLKAGEQKETGVMASLNEE